MKSKYILILLALVFVIGGSYFASIDRSINLPKEKPEEDVVVEENYPTRETTIFLGNTALNPNAIDCSKVFPVKRRIKDEPNVATLTIEKLILGPNELEKTHGYYSSLGDAELNSINIMGDVATIDFEKLPSGGSCLVGQARAQIETTLKQFDTIKEVIITLKGDSVDVLQP